jgi:hypothetical protein
LAFCGGHGADYCRRCAVAVTAPGPVGLGPRQTGFLQCVSKPRMKTIHLDDEEPPSCHRCGGLARHICQNCHSLYCREHAGRQGWCDECTRAARNGLILSAAVFGFICVMGLLIVLLNWLQSAPAK